MDVEPLDTLLTATTTTPTIATATATVTPTATATATATAAASRQKSCNACVRGKRRCDKTTPRCTRCATKGLDCVYQRHPRGGGLSQQQPLPKFSRNSNGNRNSSSSSSSNGNGNGSRNGNGNGNGNYGSYDSYNNNNFTSASSSSSSASSSSPRHAAAMDMSTDFPMNSDDICRQMQQQFGSNSNSNGNSNGNSNSNSNGNGNSNNSNSNSNSNNSSANSNSSSNDKSNGNNSGSGNDAPEMLQLDPNLDFTIADLLGHSPQDSHDANSRNGSSNPWSLPMYFGEPKADFPIAMMATPSPPPPPPPPPPPLPPPPAVAQPASAQQQQGGHKHPIRDLTLLRDESRCVSTVDPLVVHDPRSRMGYIIQYMTNMHVTFARTRCLPFIHHRLYASRLPRTMTTAFAAASAYAGRTPGTKPWVMKLLGDAAADILAHGGWARPTSATASASPVPVNAGPHSPLERLARVQAMVLLDSMRIFDGDILLRNAAEADNVVLDAWIDDLVMLRDDLENVLGHAPNNQTPKSWDAWILLESIRRTVVMALPMKCLLHLMKQPQIGPCMQPSKTSWTASQHLWTAGTSADFYHSWRTKPRWWITDWDFDDFWMYARAEDADEFTKLLLTIQLGPEVMDHYMRGDGTRPVAF